MGENNVKKVVLFASIFLVSVLAYSQEAATIACEFSKFILVTYDSTTVSQTTEISQRMRIVSGKTDDATLRLDGSVRATNSTTWTNITPKSWDTWQTTFLGNFGEILVISHELGANQKPLGGWYKASLVSSTGSSTSILLGKCLIE